MSQVQLKSRNGRWLSATLLLLAACVAGDRNTLFEPDYSISDGAHSGGTAGFYFLPPMVSQPAYSGVFDADIATVNPRVVICDVTSGVDTNCGSGLPGSTPALRVFTTASSPAITVELDKYRVNWDTKEGNFSAGRTYRLHVLAGSPARELGFADILLTTDPGKAKNLAGGETIVLNDGRTLPIHFRIEQSLVQPVGPARTLELTGLPATLPAGTPATVRVTARDVNGNVATGYRGTITFTSTDPAATLPAAYTFTAADAGTHVFTDGLRFLTAGPVTVRAADAADASLFVEAMLIVRPLDAVALEVTGLSDPLDAGAPGSVTVTARDPHGNIAAGYRGTIAFTSNDPQATLPGAYTFTDVDLGVHVFAGVTLRTAGPRTIHATDAGTPAITGALSTNVVAGAASALRFTTQPSNTAAGSAIAPAVVVTAYDAFDNVATSFSGAVSVAIGSNPGGGVLSGTAAVTAVLGVATFGDLQINAAGSGYTLTASASGLTAATSDPFDVIAQNAVVLEVGGLSDPTTAGSSQALTVTARDAHGNVATSYTGTVAFVATDGAATLPAVHSFTAADAGTHVFPGVILRQAGSHTVTAIDQAVPGLRGSQTVAVVAADAAVLILDGVADPVIAGVAADFSVTARDEFGNIATGYTGIVEFTTTDPAASAPAPYAFQAADAGVRAFPGGVTFRTAGVRTLRGTDAATPAITGELTRSVIAAAAAQLRFTVQPANAFAGSPIAPPVVVTAYDAFDNVATSFSGAVTIAIGSNPGGGVLSGAVTASAVLGVATFADLEINAAGTGYTLTALAAGLTGATSDPFDVVAQTAVALEVGGLSDPTIAGSSSAITVTARDEHGNIATAYTGTVRFTSTDGAATLPAIYTFTAADAGTRAFPGVILRQAGARTVTATDQAVPTIRGSQSVTVIAAAAASFVLDGAPGPWVAGVAQNVTVTARDPFGNIATAYTGTVEFTATDPAATVPAPYAFQAADAGVRAFPGGVTFRTAGVRTLRATDTATPTLIGALARSVIAAAATQLRFTGQPTDAIAGSPIAPPVVVTASDAFDNVATGFTGDVSIAIGTNPSSGVLSGTTTVAAAAGLATFANLVISAGGSGYTLLASAAGLTGATSASFTISSAGPTAVHWINPAGGSWNVGANWSTGIVPQPDEAAFIDLGGTYTVTVNTAVTVYDLSLGAPSGLQTLAVNNPGSVSLTNSGTIRTTGQLNVVNATLGGPGLVTNNGILRPVSGTIATPVQNEALLVAAGFSTISGALTTTTASTLRAEGNSIQGTSSLTIGTSFTNNGTIELTNTFSSHVASLSVNGTLTNAPGATINVLPGAAGGQRNLNAQLVNQGTLTITQALQMNRVGADHVNSGVIALSGGDLTILQSGTTPSFTNNGTITVPVGRLLAFNAGAFTQASGATLQGGGALNLASVNPAIFQTSFALGALTLNATTASFTPNISTDELTLTLNNAVVNGPGTLTNARGETFTLISSDVNAAFVNRGRLVNAGFSTINGGFTTDTSSTIRVEGNSVQGTSNLTVATPFTNKGLVELTNIFSTHIASLNVNGALTNDSGATIRSLPGAAGGQRNLNAELINRRFGTLTIDQPLNMTRTSADHVNDGVINLSGGNLTIQQSGATPSFTNNGTLTVAAGRNFSLNVGAFTQAGGATLSGGGAMALSSVNPAQFQTAFALSALSLTSTTAAFSTDITTDGLALGVNNSTINGPGTLTNAHGETLNLVNSIVNASLTNRGRLVDGGFSTINGALVTDTGSTLRVEGNSVQGTATLTVSTPFTNKGAIELTNTFSTHIATLNVTGALTNDSAATITSAFGAGGGPRNLNVELINRRHGTVTVAQPLTMSRVGADHRNEGVLDLSGGNLTVAQSGTTPSFTNAGTVTVPAGRTLVVSAGAFTQAAGATLSGGGAMSLTGVTAAAFETAFALGALNLTTTVASFATDLSTATLALTLNNATVNGPGTLTNAGGESLTLLNSTINTPLTNQGLLVNAGFSNVNGRLTTTAGSTLRVEGTSTQGTSTLTVDSSFTNNGSVELTNSFSTHIATLNVTGTLTNAPSAAINSLFGAGGGGRNLNVQLDNQGTLSVAQGLSISRAGADHASSGTIAVSGGDLTVNHSGTTPTFTNTGAITIATARSLINSGGAGTFTNALGGKIAGAGTLQTNAGTTLANADTISTTLVRVGAGLTSTALRGFAPTTTEFMTSASLIPTGSGFAYTNIRINTGNISFDGPYDLPGFLAVQAGNLVIGAHEIGVGGDFSTSGGGLLTMQNALGTLNVRGNVTFAGGGTNTRLTAGRLRVGGNFTQSGAGSTAAFAASTNHLTELDGAGDQTVSFTNPGSAITASHFQRLSVVNTAGAIVLSSATVANGQLSTPAAGARVIRSTGQTLTVAGLSADGLVFDGTLLRVVNGAPIALFNNATFRNMDPAATQFRLDRLNDVVTFNSITFETAPTTGLYLQLVDTDALAPFFTVTLNGTTPANHGGAVLLQGGAQLLGWPL